MQEKCDFGVNFQPSRHGMEGVFDGIAVGWGGRRHKQLVLLRKC